MRTKHEEFVNRLREPMLRQAKRDMNELRRRVEENRSRLAEERKAAANKEED